MAELSELWLLLRGAARRLDPDGRAALDRALWELVRVARWSQRPLSEGPGAESIRAELSRLLAPLGEERAAEVLDVVERLSDLLGSLSSQLRGQLGALWEEVGEAGLVVGRTEGADVLSAAVAEVEASLGLVQRLRGQVAQASIKAAGVARG